MHRGNHLPRHTDTVDLLLLNMLGNRPPLIVAYNVVLLLSHKAELRSPGGWVYIQPQEANHSKENWLPKHLDHSPEN